MLRNLSLSETDKEQDKETVLQFPKTALGGKEIIEDYLTAMDNDTHFVCYPRNQINTVFLLHYRKDSMHDGIVFLTEFMYDSTTHRIPVIPENFCHRYKLERIILIDE